MSTTYQYHYQAVENKTDLITSTCGSLMRLRDLPCDQCSQLLYECLCLRHGEYNTLLTLEDFYRRSEKDS